MNIVRVRRWFPHLTAILAAAAIAVAPGPALAQETFLLRDRHAVGDVVENESTLEVNVSIIATVAKKAMPAAKFTLHEVQRHRNEVVAVSKSGTVEGFRRIYKVNRQVESMPDGPPKTTVSSLQGKTVAVRRVNGRPVVTVAAGKIAPKDHQELMGSLDRAQALFFPSHPVAIGKEWTIAAKTLAIIFPDTDSASASGQLLEFVTFENQRCAHVKVTINLVDKIDGTPMTMSMKLTGDLYQSMETERALSFLASGPVTVSGRDKSPQGPIDIAGTGTMKMEMSSNWIKIAGKAATVEPIVVN